MSAPTIIESFGKLSLPEKICLLQDLWDEVADESASMPPSESHRRFLDERLRKHEETPEDVESWEKVRSDILSEL